MSEDKKQVPTDVLGREVRVGDTITYPVRQFSSMWVNVVEVLEIRERTNSWDPPFTAKVLFVDGEGEGRTTRFSSFARCTVVCPQQRRAA